MLDEQHTSMIAKIIRRIPHQGKDFEDGGVVGGVVPLPALESPVVPEPPVGVEFVLVFVVLLVVVLVTLQVCANFDTSTALESVTLMV